MKITLAIQMNSLEELRNYINGSCPAKPLDERTIKQIVNETITCLAENAEKSIEDIVAEQLSLRRSCDATMTPCECENYGLQLTEEEIEEIAPRVYKEEPLDEGTDDQTLDESADEEYPDTGAALERRAEDGPEPVREGSRDDGTGACDEEVACEEIVSYEEEAIDGSKQ